MFPYQSRKTRPIKQAVFGNYSEDLLIMLFKQAENLIDHIRLLDALQSIAGMVIIQIIYIYIMNVKNLKEMFERQATIKIEAPLKPIQKRSLPPPQAPEPNPAIIHQPNLP